MDSHMDGTVPDTTVSTSSRVAASPRVGLISLVLAQFIASYACSNMNVAITSIANDIGTTVRGVQTAITLFTLTMAALMIPGSKLTDIWGRKFCFRLGLGVYGAGAIIAAVSTSLGILIVGYSLLEGIGSALMIPPIYILVTVTFSNLESRARAFGLVSAAAGLGAALGPLIGGLVTSAISWRASFLLQVLVILTIFVMSRQLVDPGVQGARPRFDLIGAIISALGLLVLVVGIQLSGTYGWGSSREDFTIGNTVVIPKGGISPVWVFIALGVLILLGFFLYIRSEERAGKTPLLSTHLFRNRTSNLGLVTQNIQWLTLQGTFFVVSVFLQDVRKFSAVQTGLMLTPATIGILVTGSLAERFASRRPQRLLIIAGFAFAIVGTLLLLLMVRVDSSIASFIPGLLLIGLGIGVMLTSSVNVVQSAFSDRDQGEISGVSRSVSNLGSSLGTSLVGSVLVVSVLPGNQDFALAMIIMIVIGLIGLVAAVLIPAARTLPKAQQAKTPQVGSA